LIREHARKYQFGLAEASVWLRRKGEAKTGGSKHRLTGQPGRGIA
jgi:hypothetical protein